MGGGQLIYLPEITQADLNSFCHVLFCALGNNTGYQESAQSIYRSFRFRSQPIENTFGAGTSNPAIMGQLISEYQGSQSAAQTAVILKDIRLLPLHAKFRIQLDVWAKAALQELEAEKAAQSHEPTG